MTEVDKIRIVRSEKLSGSARTHTVGALSIAQFSAALAASKDAVLVPMGDDAFKAGLHIFDLRTTEGFFADLVVLVEGISDKAIIEGFARSQGKNLASKGVLVISVDGKDKMARPLYAFKHFGIRYFAVYDNDENKGGKPDLNRQLQVLCNVAEIEDWPDCVASNYATFKGNLELYLRSVCGESYEKLRESVANHFELKPSNIEKTPAAVSAFLLKAADAGYAFEKLDAILAQIWD